MSLIEDLLRKQSDLLKDEERERLSGFIKNVTLLFTDIVGSTSYYEKWGDIAGRRLVQTHNDLLFPVISEFNGTLIKTIGDAIMAAFETAQDALLCTMKMQSQIALHNLNAGIELRFEVRMGLHYGKAVFDEKDLFGDAVNTAARVESLAGGGEILISKAVMEQLTIRDVDFVTLGEEEIRGRTQPIELYAVDWNHAGRESLLGKWVERKKQVHISYTQQRLSIPSHRNKGHGNPYLNRVMLSNPDQFFGRKEILRRVFRKITGNRPQSISLVGERRIGKSSLLNYIRSPECRLEYLKSPDDFFFVYIDFQQVISDDSESILILMQQEVSKQTSIAINGHITGKNLLDLGEFLERENLRLIFLFDEFERITRSDKVDSSLYSMLRSLANSFPIAYICASGRDLKEMCVSREISESPFFNIFSFMYLGLFTAAEAMDLISGPSGDLGNTLQPVQKYILEMGGHHPFFLQIACSVWYDFLLDTNTEADIYIAKEIPNDVIELFREEVEPHFEYIIETMSKKEKEILISICLNNKFDDDYPLLLKKLIRKGYVIDHGNSLALFSYEFLRVIKRSCND